MKILYDEFIESKLRGFEILEKRFVYYDSFTFIANDDLLYYGLLNLLNPALIETLDGFLYGFNKTLNPVLFTNVKNSVFTFVGYQFRVLKFPSLNLYGEFANDFADDFR